MLLSSFRLSLRATALAGALALFVVLALVISPAARADTPGTFTTLASSPEEINAVVVDPTTNLIYAQEDGGYSFYRYNPATNAWTTLASAPLEMDNNAGAAYVDGKIYVSYSDPSTDPAELGVYDIATNSWTTITSPIGEGTGDITAVGGLVYLVDGTSFVSYDPATGVTKTLADAPAFTDTSDQFGYGYCPGYGFQNWGALAPYGGDIYGTQGNGCNGFAEYDIASNKWTELSLVDGYTVLGGAIDPVTGTYYAYGGYDGDSFFAYDIASGKWSTSTFPYDELDDGGLAYVSTPGLQGIYATYGQDSTGFTRYNTPGVDVSITKSASAKRVDVGHKLTYTLTVKNSSLYGASNVTVSDKLPTAVKFVSDKPSQGTCSGTSTVSCSLGTVGAGASATVKIKVTAKKKGKVKNTATVTTSSPNLSSATSASATVRIVEHALKLTVSPHQATAGKTTCYAFKATSGGKAVRGVSVRLAGHTTHSSSKGTASLCLSLHKGTYHARASKDGYRSATDAIRVTAAPSFTG